MAGKSLPGKRGTRRHNESFMNKRDFVAEVKQRGMTFTEVRTNKGQWNEGTEFYVCNTSLTFQPKGERTNWVVFMNHLAVIKVEPYVSWTKGEVTV